MAKKKEKPAASALTVDAAAARAAARNTDSGPAHPAPPAAAGRDVPAD